MVTNQSQIPTWPGWETEHEPIGSGGFGTVYKIHRKLFDYSEVAALKVISIPQKRGDIDEMISDGYDQESISNVLESHLKSILAEYSMMRKMNGHSNIVNCDDVHYVEHSDGIGWDIYIKMELLTPLTKALPRSIPEETVVKVGRDMCAALELCRKYEIVHRDIKPQNIFVSDSGEYKLGDFGIAKTVEKTMGGTKIGTYNYMAPEVFHNKPYGSVADICSLGLVLYWMLNERRIPFLPLHTKKLEREDLENARYKRLFGEPLPEPAHGSDELKRIVLKACAYDPAERYQTAAQMLADLDALAGFQHIHVPPVAPVNDPPPVVEQPPKTERLVPETEATVLTGEETVLGTDSTILGSDSTVLLTETDPQGAGAGNGRRSRRRRDEQGGSGGSPKRKGAIKWILLAAAAVIAALLLRSCFGNVQTPPPEESTAPSETLPPETTVPPIVLHGMGEWSEWVDALPSDVTKEEYVIQEMPVYRSRTLQIQSSADQTAIDGWEYVETKDEPGEFGEWSSWSTTAVTASDTCQVEKEDRYRYRTKETTTSSSSSKSGWTLYDTTYTKGDFGAWSDWSTTAVKETDTVDVDTKTQYRYRDKETTTSSASSLSGWTQYDSSYEWGGWSEWSAWSDEPVSATDTREVRTQEVEVGGGSTKYTYGAYFSNDSTKPSSFSYFCGTCAAELYGGTWTYKTYTQTTAASKLSMSVSCAHKGTISCQYFADNGRIYYSEKVSSEGSSYKTQYSYRTREKSYTYYYYRWGAWSSYSDTKVSSSDKREVSTRTLYRSRKCTQDTTYHFYRWSDWSDWSTKAVSASKSKEVEKKTYYRHRDCQMLKVNYFQRWSDWSEYDSRRPEASETVQVEGKLLLRYATRPTDGSDATVQISYTDLNEGSATYEAVRWAADQGVMPATGSDTFGPAESCTRRELVIMLWRVMDYPEPKQTQSPFTDVSNADPYWKAIVWAVENGIISGESAEIFGTDSPCTRAQVITLLYRTSGSPAVTLAQEPFEDVEKGMYFYDAVLWAYEHNISSGVTTTQFGVNDPCSRGQIAVMLHRTFGA